MSGRRILGLMRQEFYISIHSFETIMDVFVMTILSVLVFGFFSKFASDIGNTLAAQYILLGFVLWEVFQVGQYSVSMTTMWNIWSRNLANLFITPISIAEYLTAQLLSGSLKAVLVFLIVAWVAASAFGFSIFVLPPTTLVPVLLILLVSAWGLGIALLGFILAFGTRYQALLWGIIFVFQPLTAVFYPVTVLPGWMQVIAMALPPTYAFEAARAVLGGGSRPDLLTTGSLLAVGYLLLSLMVFDLFLKHAKRTGQLAKAE